MSRRNTRSSSQVGPLSSTLSHAESLVISEALTDGQRHIVNRCAKGPGPYVVSPLSHDSPPARPHARVPGVPRVYDVFHDGAGSTYLVMEYVDASSFRVWVDEPGLSATEREIRTATAVAAIADTIALLLNCPHPEGDGIGPVGGGYIQHSFFGMEEAPVPFVNAAALEKYVNKALTRRPGGAKNNRLYLEAEDRILCPSDVSLDNFLWDPETQRVWMIDFQHVNILPKSFFSFYLHRNTDPFVQAVAAKIGFPVSSQLGLLASAAGIVIQSGISAFGLDMYGYPKPRRRKISVA